MCSRVCFALLILFLLLSNDSYTQYKYSLCGGMGINYGNTPSFNDYLRRELSFSSADSIKSFNTGIEFFLSGEYVLSSNFSAKIDYSYFIRSSNYTYQFYVFDHIIKIHQPYLFLNYVINKKRYSFRFGLGAGYHFQILENHISTTNLITYRSSGPSLRCEFTYKPLLSRRFSGLISAFIYGNLYNSLKAANGSYLVSNSSDEKVNLGGYGVGLRLGIGYIF
ncbi:MAG: hypothetical protein N2510_06565 [Ignavibacteria bacterium]|nr:hypothetical protein [Ignavibacteria bacterium]